MTKDHAGGVPPDSTTLPSDTRKAILRAMSLTGTFDGRSAWGKKAVDELEALLASQVAAARIDELESALYLADEQVDLLMVRYLKDRIKRLKEPK